MQLARVWRLISNHKQSGACSELLVQHVTASANFVAALPPETPLLCQWEPSSLVLKVLIQTLNLAP